MITVCEYLLRYSISYEDIQKWGNTDKSNIKSELFLLDIRNRRLVLLNLKQLKWLNSVKSDLIRFKAKNSCCTSV